MALLIEMVVDLGMNWAGIFAASSCFKTAAVTRLVVEKPLMRILGAIVEPTTGLLAIGVASL